jgi:hypothetical protein
VTLTTANRKLLWARSGGFCAICKGLLTEDATDLDPAVVTGMEAHIVSAQRGGPRHRRLAPAEVDDPENLILLCPTDHAVVDKQDSHYNESQLREIKRDHEQWVRDRGADTRRARIRDPQADHPTIAHRVVSGSQLMSVAGGSEAMQTSAPDRLTPEEMDLVASFLQNVADWSELWGQLGHGERLRAEHDVTQELDDLLAAGFLVYVGARPQILEGGIGAAVSWRLAVLLVARSDEGAENLPSGTETAVTTAERRARIVRSNVQLVIDEIAVARRTMIEALDDGWVFWDREIEWDKWENVRADLASEKGFHAAYNTTRSAWEAIQRVETVRLGRRTSGDNPYEIKSWESRWVQSALDLADEAEMQLIRFLGNYSPESG